MNAANLKKLAKQIHELAVNAAGQWQPDDELFHETIVGLYRAGEVVWANILNHEDPEIRQLNVEELVALADRIEALAGGARHV